MYNPIQSYKQVTIDGPASRAAATDINHRIALGVDNYTGPSAANEEVPTGAKISSIDVQIAASNLVSVTSLLFITVQFVRSGQGIISPNSQGGNPQRNQITYTRMVMLGKDQNNNFHFRVRVPRMYQRMREGAFISIVTRADTVWASATQAIYKFYR